MSNMARWKSLLGCLPGEFLPESLKSGSTHISSIEMLRVPVLTTSDWLWPAIWMLPTEDKYGVWPKSGEIDVCPSLLWRGQRIQAQHSRLFDRMETSRLMVDRRIKRKQLHIRPERE